MQNPDFELDDFIPYLLNRAAEETSLGFQRHYKARYGMLRTEWRVLFHLGRFGEMTAKSICERARIHKTKVSRAVAALETKKLLQRQRLDHDRRHEGLRLTRKGVTAFEDLQSVALTYNGRLMARYSATERQLIEAFLKDIAERGQLERS